ncbi:MAG TPA: ABATE domain-containing protein [Steroidobacteraceae bacterium]|jgi:predicted RNA-binding Zn ribbon-like protein|nr:ABATE domain-containing protein [Steroidobacteraceae bacterium]
MTDTPSPSWFVAGHPAIDFLNTAYAPGGVLVETIGDGRALLDWMMGAGLVDKDEAARLARRFTRKSLDAAAEEARTVREWARTWIEAWRANPARDYGDEIAALNKLLARESRGRELVANKRRLELIERPHFEDARELIAPIALEIARLVTQEDPSLVKACAGAECTLQFLDRTKAHRRVFCSATACGNRAKVAAFRRRAQRATTE